MRAFNVGSSVLLATLALLELCFAEAWGICLMTPPCGCHDDPSTRVYCAFKSLQAIPPYGLFPDIVWTELDLSQNFLTTVPRGGLKGVRVEFLNMRHNTIDTLHPDSFAGIRDLVILDLSHNHLVNLPPRFLHPLQELQSLRLKYNQINDITPMAFWGAHHVTELDLTGNELSAVPGKAVRLLSGLKRLILRTNRLKTIDSNSFYHLPLEYLDIGDNGVSVVIDSGAFCGLDPQVENSEPGVTDWIGLNTLRLDHNGLSGIHPCVTKTLWTLNKVDLSGNPLHCTCQLLALRIPGSKTEFPEAQCASPSRLAGQYLDQINVSRTNCGGLYRPTNCEELCTKPPPLLEQFIDHKTSSISSIEQPDDCSATLPCGVPVV
ncbi:hypothetical protein CAPTEDRAFT_227678 [Capitella teleta]|uniref:LRRNT domain-containing protein n=1 Tax=Capitella teleta TaxID=283909 RepID=R7UPA7_CAPTE|nr:hypothetical protein CAPTEDRAFT_227678 [Capitella teleta]|eukprot:ELU08359.1 hypothetical protein CAPTEDRAFT_227678 [Capitella teleta]